MNAQVELVIPSQKYYQSYAAARDEFRRQNVNSYDFFAAESAELFTRIENFRTGKNMPPGYVKASYLWLVQEDEFIGEVSVRHSLTDSLLRFGGNIGYAVSFSKWNQGFGTIMLAKALVYAKESIGLGKVLITCNDNNLASARVIEKNGGVLQDKIINTIGGVDRLTRRYWIELS